MAKFYDFLEVISWYCLQSTIKDFGIALQVYCLYSLLISLNFVSNQNHGFLPPTAN